MTPYIQGAIKEREHNQRMLQRRYEYAWEVAKKAASILKTGIFCQ
jgi:hypothetical protein